MLEHNKNIMWHTKPQKFCDTKINIEYNLEESTQGEKQTQEMPQETGETKCSNTLVMFISKEKGLYQIR